MRRFILLTLFVGCLGAGPCDKILPDALKGDIEEPESTCTELECENSLIVEVIRSDNDQFIGGAYSIVAYDEVSAYAWTLECHLLLAESGLECDAFGVPDEDAFAAELIDEGRTIVVYLAAAPPLLTVTVDYNGAILGARTIAPVYKPFTPNGPDCEPVCYEADEVMAVTTW